jgi:hypothetical protein
MRALPSLMASFDIEEKIICIIIQSSCIHKPTVLSYVSIFESLWSRSIVAKERTKEIEERAKREFVETIRDPSKIQEIGFELIKKAEKEILVLFSTVNAFRRQEKAGDRPRIAVL